MLLFALQAELAASSVHVTAGSSTMHSFLGIPMPLKCMAKLMGFHKRQLTRALGGHAFVDGRCSYKGDRVFTVQGPINRTPSPPIPNECGICSSLLHRVHNTVKNSLEVLLVPRSGCRN